jgi:DNA-binding PadR family transcriptional regulator
MKSRRRSRNFPKNAFCSRKVRCIPILHKLEADGHVTVQDEHIGKRLRRYYALTETGKTEAASQVSELVAFFATVRRFIDPLPDLAFSI